MNALVVCNGFPPSEELLAEEVQKADLIIGADRGGNILLDHNITPDFVIGDMDSFQKPETVNFEIIFDPSQETNDLEKALNLALDKDAENCIVLGAFGKRMDHSLKNLSVLKQFHSLFHSLIFKDEDQRCLLITSSFESSEPAGTIVSLFPLSGRVEGITTEGLKFPLKNEALINGERDGTSNETVEDSFSVEIKSGDLVVFISRGK